MRFVFKPEARIDVGTVGEADNATDGRVGHIGRCSTMIDAVTSSVQPAGQATTAGCAEIPCIFVRVQTFW